MSCERIRENLIDAIAAGEPEFSAELARHLLSCDGCRAFYETEARLFLSMEKGIRTIVDQLVPISLLPRVRERLDESAAPRKWIYALVPVAALLVFAALAAAPSMRHWFETAEGRVASVRNKATAAAKNEALSAMPDTGMVASRSVVSNSSRRSLKTHLAPPAKKEAEVLEVLVGEDELRGLALLSSTVYRKPEIANALLHPIIPAEESTQPIVLQKIVPLEVAGLEICPLAEENR
jgi:anti-sigma factor RsiW